jgi:hypothetical protein
MEIETLLALKSQEERRILISAAINRAVIIDTGPRQALHVKMIEQTRQKGRERHSPRFAAWKALSL